MQIYVHDFREIGPSDLEVVGGKGVGLGVLSRLDGANVPGGFCVSTAAFRSAMATVPVVGELRSRLGRLKAKDREAIRDLSAEIRQVIEGVAIPEAVRVAIQQALSRAGTHDAYAIRSSTTAEDLPMASSAGQQDTFLNVVGEQAILAHIRRCWASLFTERAVVYRLQQGVDHHAVQMGVVVQKMIPSQAAGTLFTADPVTASREVIAIEAVAGLGEALVSGLVRADGYTVRRGQITSRRIATKSRAVFALPGGGTQEQALPPEQQHSPVLTDAQIVRLAHLGRMIACHLGHPQDIEWCLVGEVFSIVQSRPITTLFPIPEGGESGKRVYVSVGHQQMMTDPMKPLGLSVFQLTAGRPMYAAGGRLFVDPTAELAAPASRDVLLNVLGRSDPLIRDALTTVVERGDIFPALPIDPPGRGPGPGRPGPLPLDDDPSVVTDLLRRGQATIAALTQDIQTKSGTALLDFILDDIQQLRESTRDPRSFGVIMAAISASSWINDQMSAWLGEKNAADTLSLSVPHNVTAEMGLALLDVADAVRPYPAVIQYLQYPNRGRFMEDLMRITEGGPEAHAALRAFLDQYGMRCVGEIDVTRARWSEDPATLAPVILSHLQNLPPGASRRRFAEGQEEARKKEQDLLARLHQLPDGEQKARDTQQMIRRLRAFIGYREYPKYHIVCRYALYKQALRREAEQLVHAGVILEKDDIDYLTLQELRNVVQTHALDMRLVPERKAAHAHHQRLTPPMVMMSDGEIITGTYRRSDLPVGVLVGLPVSAGVVEGRARVVLDLAGATLEAGDILVTPFTDPSWTPLFLSIRGLVTEVGGLMAHGAVIAREYGLPAVIGVENATRLISDGQRIRVNGADGTVEILA